MSRLIINYCKDENITPNDLMVLFAVGFQVKGLQLTKVDKENSLARLKQKQLINDKGELTTKGSRYIVSYDDSLKILEGRGKSAQKKVTEAKITSIVEKFISDYRKLFTVKTGGMGDKLGCTKKMERFFKEYPEYGDVDLIMKATKKYINSVNDYTYLKRADYFIFKSEGGDKSSMLASYCEEVELDKDKVQFNKHDMI